MNTQIIERIRGYCTEVNQSQWEELVRVADEVGMLVGYNSRKYGVTITDRYARLNGFGDIGVYFDRTSNTKQIPFPDFLAKLRGVKVWTPKAGEMVEVSIGGENWVAREFIGERKELYWAWYEDRPNSYSHCRSLSPTITRAEAEAQLGKRIID